MITGMNTPFGSLTPDRILGAVEEHCGVFLDGSLTTYNSYINRVFGVKDDDEKRYIVKFYRPGRWTAEAISDEHAFLADCANAEIPVVPPLSGKNGATAGTLKVAAEEGTDAAEIRYAVFPFRPGRTFDIATEDDWVRTGRAIGRMHRAGAARKAASRIRCTPEETTARYIQNLTGNALIHPDCLEDFVRVATDALDRIEPLFDSLSESAFQRIHGDCHRGNILESAEREITLIDFDDMMVGPAVQDLWLLLPGHLNESMREMNLILEGYEQFADFNRATLELIEPLRFMRHVYFLNWCAIQRDDAGFAARFPGWGSRAFWIQENEDLTTQLAYLAGK